jgi:hypothetical protein
LIGKSIRQFGRRGALGWIGRATLAVTVASTLGAAGMGVAAAGTGTVTVRAASTAAAHAAPARNSTSARVVKVRHRRHFGRILVTAKKGRALYILPQGHCRGACLMVWPRLKMPKGTTIPKGTSCLLGTAKFGSHHRLQVTYNGKRLYKFAQDSGHSVRGNGVGGFAVAKKIRCMM